MQATLKLTDSLAVEHTFQHRNVDANGVATWTAESLQNDLAGVRVLTRGSQKTRAGIVSRNLKLTLPVFNTDTDKYEGTVQARIVLNAPATAPIVQTINALRMIIDALQHADNTGMEGDFVSGY